jgi:sec-independent protein translocase protein TatA
MFDVGPGELIIVLLIVILIFGPGRLSKLGGDLGSGIRSFRQGLSGDGDEKKEKSDDEKPEEEAKEETPSEKNS